MSAAFAMSQSQDLSNLFLAGAGSSSSSALMETQQQIQLQPVFIPRHQHNSFSGGVGSSLTGLQPQHQQHQPQPGSPPNNSGSNLAAAAAAAAAAASADWAYLLRNAAALRTNGGSPQQGDPLGHANSPHQVMSSPGGLMRTISTAPQTAHVLQHAATTSNSASASGLFGNKNSMANNLDTLGQLSADALAPVTGDPSNSFAMLSNGGLAPTLSGGMYPGGNDGVQTLAYGLSNSLNLNSLMKLEESLSGSLFGSGCTPAALSPKPVSASLYIKNLPLDADKLFLYEKFSPYGAILSVKVLNDPQSGQCRGVGFVNFAEHTSAMRSIQALHGTKVGDKLLHVSLQTPRLRAAALAGM